MKIELTMDEIDDIVFTLNDKINNLESIDVFKNCNEIVKIDSLIAKIRKQCYTNLF